jgi:hypothetical protein
MRPGSFRYRLNQFGAWLFAVALWAFGSWQAWTAWTTGTVLGSKSTFHSRVESPFLYWESTVLWTAIAVFPALLFVPFAIFKMAGRIGLRKPTREERFLSSRRVFEFDDARRRDTNNRTIGPPN